MRIFDLEYDSLGDRNEAENNNSSGKIVSNSNTYSKLMRNGSEYDNPKDLAADTGKVSVVPHPDEHLYYSKPMPRMQNLENPCYGGPAFIAGAARLTKDEPLYETADAVRQDGE